MRLISIGILAVSLASGGCKGTETPINRNALATPSTAASTPDTKGAPIATAGRAEATPAPAPGSSAAAGA